MISNRTFMNVEFCNLRHVHKWPNLLIFTLDTVVKFGTKFGDPRGEKT